MSVHLSFIVCIVDELELLYILKVSSCSSFTEVLLTVVCDATGLSCSPVFSPLPCHLIHLVQNADTVREWRYYSQSETECLILLTKHELLTKSSVR